MKLKLSLCLAAALFCLAASAQYENVSKGSIIDINGVKAIVFKIGDDGHGTAMSVKSLRGQKHAWGNNNKVFSSLDLSDKDGQANTSALMRYMEEKNIPLSEIPIVKWCRSLGAGWYIPSAEQIEEFVNYYLGNDQEYSWDDDEEVGNLSPKEINELLVDNGGHPFLISAIRPGMAALSGVYTSTKTPNNKVMVYQYDFDKNTWKMMEYSPTRLNTFTMGRAFYDF